MSLKKIALITTIVGLILCLLCIASVLLSCYILGNIYISSTSGNCNTDIMIPQKVNITPFVELQLPPDTSSINELVSSSILEGYHFVVSRSSANGYMRFEDTDGGYSSIQIYITGNAVANEYDHRCMTGSLFSTDNSNLDMGVIGDTKYCLSCVTEEKAGPMGGCKPLGYYISYLVLQKNDFMIYLFETTSDNYSDQKSVVIQQLSQAIEAWVNQSQGDTTWPEPVITITPTMNP